MWVRLCGYARRRTRTRTATSPRLSRKPRFVVHRESRHGRGQAQQRNMRPTKIIVPLALALGLACGHAKQTSDGEDPGQPDLIYGTKAGGELRVADSKVGSVFFSFIAPDEADRSHVFARGDLANSPGLRSYYLSLVVATERWSVREYDGAIAGRVEFVLTDGRRYAADAKDLHLHVKITRDSVSEGGHYPTGTMELTVPSEPAGEEPLEARLTINNPDVAD
jgi:hypothetical protein